MGNILGGEGGQHLFKSKVGSMIQIHTSDLNGGLWAVEIWLGNNQKPYDVRVLLGFWTCIDTMDNVMYGTPQPKLD